MTLQTPPTPRTEAQRYNDGVRKHKPRLAAANYMAILQEFSDLEQGLSESGKKPLKNKKHFSTFGVKYFENDKITFLSFLCTEQVTFLSCSHLL